MSPTVNHALQSTFSPKRGDADDYTSLVAPTLSDPDAAKYVQGVGLQYAGIGLINAIKQANPSLKTWETETPCGGGRARDCGTGPGTRNNSWAWGESQWSTMRSFLEAGASVYSQWNMVWIGAFARLYWSVSERREGWVETGREGDREGGSQREGGSHACVCVGIDDS